MGVPKLARMSLSATFTIVMSTSAINAAHMTTNVIPILLPVTVPFTTDLSVLGLDADVGAHPGAKRDVLRLVVDAHEHRDPLHYLGEVAGSVVGREERKTCTGSRLHAVHVAHERATRKGIDLE